MEEQLAKKIYQLALTFFYCIFATAYFKRYGYLQLLTDIKSQIYFMAP